MTAEVSPLNSIQENIKTRIKAEFVNLIPDEAWSAMVAGVVQDFTSPVRDRYNGNVKISPVQAMIRAEIESIAKAHIKSEIEALSGSMWDAFGQRVAGEAVKKLIADNFQLILASVQAGMVEMAVMTATNHIRNSMQRVM